MNGFFFASNAKTNAEHRIVIKKRMVVPIILFILGLLTLGASFIGSSPLDSHLPSYYNGLGCGFIVGAIVILIKYFLLLSNEEKLKADRLKDSDERLQNITSKAFRIATIVLIITLYVVYLIGGILYPDYLHILSMFFCIQMLCFLVTYTVFYKIYEKKM